MGGWYSLGRKRIEQGLLRSDLIFYAVLAFSGSFFLWTGTRKSTFLYYELWVAAFTVCVLLLSMKIVPCSGFLTLLGSHVFGLYIMQRLPMLMLESRLNLTRHPYVFVLMSFLGMIVAGLAFDRATAWLDAQIFDRKNKTGDGSVSCR